MDKITLNQMEFYGFHGLLPEEKKLGQRFLVTVHLYAQLQRAGQLDRMEESIDYAHVYDVVKEIVEGESKNLIEAVAEAIADALLKTFPRLKACHICVVKPDPPIVGHYESVSVEIYREQSL